MANRGDTLTAVEVLALAALSDGPRYGYELVQTIEELSDGQLQLRPGNLYRVLHRLEDRGLAREVEHGGSDDDGRRQYFEATAEGRRAAARQLAMYGRILDRSPGLIGALGDG